MRVGLVWVALSALPVECDAAENCTTLLGVPKADGGYASDPILGIVSNMGLGPLQGPAPIYVAVLAGTIRVAAINAGVLGSRGWSTRSACIGRCPTACAGCIRTSGRRTSAS